MLADVSESLKERPKLLVKMDSRNSFVMADLIKMKGVRVGATFGRVTNVGIGYSWSKHSELNEFNSFTYRTLSAFIEYKFAHYKSWTAEIPVHIGLGFSRALQKGIVKGRATYLVYEPAMIFDYHFLKYFSAGLGAGFRWSPKMSGVAFRQYSSPIYIFRFNIFFDKIYEDHLKKD